MSILILLITSSISFVYGQINENPENFTVIGIPDREPDSDGWYNMPFEIVWKVSNVNDSNIVCENPTTYSDVSGNNLELQGRCFDIMNNTRIGVFKFKYDSVKPQINPLRDITEYSEDRQGKVVYYDLPDAADNLGGTSDVICNPISGTLFDLGTTKITCNAMDAAGNVSNTIFFINIKLIDNDKPTIDIINDEIIFKTTQVNGTIIDYFLPPVYDNVEVRKYQCNPEPKSHFIIGPHKISCIAEDTAGNIVNDNFTIILDLVDNYSLFLETPQDLIIDTITNEIIVNYTPPLVGDDFGILEITCDPPSGSIFKIGDHKINCVATDMAANIDTASFLVTVNYVDIEPPTIQISNTTIVENIESLDVPVTYSIPDVSDNVKVESILCDPPSGSVFDLGINQINCIAKDSFGNQSIKSFNIDVNLTEIKNTTNIQIQDLDNYKINELDENKDHVTQINQHIIKNDYEKNIPSFELSLILICIVSIVIISFVLKYRSTQKNSSVKLHIKFKQNSNDITFLDKH